jgi:hypothetical protein
MKKSRSKFLKIVDEKHDINFHWPKPPTISPWTIFCVSSKQVRHKQVSHKQGNKRVLSSDYWAYINFRGLIIGGVIFGWAYIRVGLYLE